MAVKSQSYSAMLDSKTQSNIKRKSRISAMKLKDNIEFFLMSLPVIIQVIIFSYIPMAGIIIAFKSYRFDTGIFGSEWVGLRNFEFFFKSLDAVRITSNTVLLNLMFISVGTVVTVAFALIMFEVSGRKLIKTYQTIMILPHFLSWVVVGYMLYAFLNPSYGFINGMLKGVGIKEIAWYSAPQAWPPILMLMHIWKGVGMGCIIYYAGLMSIDSELFEAAKLDGANKWHETWYIKLPSLKPLVIILTILAIGGIFRSDFGMFYQLTRDSGALYPTTDVIDTYVFRALKSLGQYEMGAAVGLFQSFVGFVMIIITNAIVKKIEPESSLF